MKAERDGEPTTREVAAKYYINAKGQMVMATLVEDNENPDGVFYMKSYQEISPPPPGTRRPYGRTIRLPDKQINVRIVEGDVLSEEPTLEQIDELIKFWGDYSPIVKE